MASHASPRTSTGTRSGNDKGSGNLLCRLPVAIVVLLAIAPSLVASWTSTSTSTTRARNSNIHHRPTTTTATAASTPAGSSWFLSETIDTATTSDTATTPPIRQRTLEQRKAELLQLGAALDRGQAYNPTSGSYYADRMEAAEQRIAALIAAHPNNVPNSLSQMLGEWELILTTVPHGIFRSSPFFLAIQQAFEDYAETKTSFGGVPKAELFFKLHELQTCSWGASKIGRVAQTITKDRLYSEFDTSLFSLTVIPIVGWFKLLPTFGGCVVTVAKAHMSGDSNSNGDNTSSDSDDQDTEPGVLHMQVDYTTAVPVPGLQGLGSWIWNVKVPVNAVWKLLPWNKGRDANCRVYIRYCDDDFRIVQDVSGEYFVYTRPVLSRPLVLAQQE
jgi:hypothetical protein